MTFTKPQAYRAFLYYKEKVSSKVYEAKFKLQAPPLLTFVAGQTVMLHVGNNINRAMTIASPPQQTSELTIFQDISPMGPGSIWMINLRVGDPVQFVAPLGRFVLDEKSQRKKVFIATGTGIAPFRSMFYDASKAWMMSGDVSLYWGLRHEEDMFLVEEIKEFSIENPMLTFYFTLSQPNADWTGLMGRVNEHVFAKETELPMRDFYLCGSKEMIKEMQERLKTAGVPEEQIKNDPFF